MKRLVLVSILFSVNFVFSAARAEEAANDHQYEMPIYLDHLCADEAKKNTEAEAAPNAEAAALAEQKKQVCEAIRNVGEVQQGEPVLAKFKDTQKNDWVFKFHFGFSRVNYLPTDLHVNTSKMRVVIKDFKVIERTSATAYSPKEFTQNGKWLQWIDEPTNLFDLAIEHKDNVYYVTIFHPKFLKPWDQWDEVHGEVNGAKVSGRQNINDHDFTNPNALHISEFQNTHRQMDWQIGYGKKLHIFKTKKFGSLDYTPHGHLGMTTGASNVILVNQDGKTLDQVVAANEFQGVNASIGHMLEYNYGRVNLFIDQKFTYSHLQSKFMDGVAQYDMKYSSVAFGVGVKLFRIHPKAKR